MAEHHNILKLGESLVEKGVITPQQLEEALRVQKTDKRKLGEILIEKFFLSDELISKALSEIYNLPFVQLTQVHIEDDVLGLVPYEILKKHKVLPLNIKDSALMVATNDPLDVLALQEIQYISGYQVRPVIASTQDITIHLDNFIETLHTYRASKIRTVTDKDEIPIINLVESIISKAIKERASDIHFQPMMDHMRVRFRIDGQLYEKTSITKDLERKVVSRIKIISGMDVADSRRPQDGRLSPDKFKDYDIRVSSIPDTMGENLVLRLLNKSFTNVTFDSLGMDPAEKDAINTLIQQPYGMILVTGPTGAGKTTTLYSILNSLNDVSSNIITVEDPVEYQMEGINQTAINVRAGYTFATAIRHILRHDPDIIMVGEIRDMETAEIAIRAALTGHLVLSTLHTNTAAGAVMRLLDMNIEPFLIRSAVIGVIAQRLVRRLCPHCRKEYTPAVELRARMEQLVSVPADAMLASPGGCEKCAQTGFSGRVGIFESLLVNEGIRQLILKSPSEEAITQYAVSHGMKTLRMSGYTKALQKVTSLEEVMSITFSE